VRAETAPIDAHRHPAESFILGQSRTCQNLRTIVNLTARRSTTVLLEGETGVGKEVAAREIHRLSPRGAQPFIPVDCTLFSNDLMDSQLFGHVKGAFTSAIASSLGFLRCANGGTLLLDEIGELPLPVQAKLLRTIQERAVVPVGAAEPIPVDVRIVAATHRDLSEMVRAGTFRQDLYYRLNVVRITIPPLRERRDDIHLLAQHFLDDIAQSYQEPTKRLSAAAVKTLTEFSWPGNVRELRNTIERAFLFCSDRTIDVVHLPDEIRHFQCAPPQDDRALANHAFDASIPRLADAERLLIARVLRFTGGNQSDAARLLGIERHRLRRKILLHGLQHLARIRPR
jgi:transcriptional regulator with PAS, ATPase and Fis domain